MAAKPLDELDQGDRLDIFERKVVEGDGPWLRGKTLAIGREANVKPLAKTVATMEPIVAGYAVTRWKIAGAFALGTTIITVLGWVVSLFAGKIVAWVLSSFR